MESSHILLHLGTWPWCWGPKGHHVCQAFLHQPVKQWERNLTAEWLYAGICREPSAATVEVKAHLSVKPRESVSVSEALEATGFKRSFLLQKALSFRLQQRSPAISHQQSLILYLNPGFAVTHLGKDFAMGDICQALVQQNRVMYNRKWVYSGCFQLLFHALPHEAV